MSWTEYQAIKIHDGMYDDANKPYFVARSAQAKLKTNLPVILHHGDHMAAQIEFERWRNRNSETPKVSSEKSRIQKSNGLKNLAENNPDVESSLQDLFKAFNQD
jgi:L-ascorbate metabolism protein UlaG (beta-lactamase superfamily)